MNVANLNIYPLGDQALTIQLHDQIDASTNQQVMQIFHHLQNHPIKGVTDIIPAYSSITIVYNLVQIKPPPAFSSIFEWIKTTVVQQIALMNTNNLVGRLIKIPVCYDVSLGLDLIELSEHSQLPIEAIIHRHAGLTYAVYMIGFLPGFQIGRAHV